MASYYFVFVNDIGRGTKGGQNLSNALVSHGPIRNASFPVAPPGELLNINFFRQDKMHYAKALLMETRKKVNLHYNYNKSISR